MKIANEIEAIPVDWKDRPVVKQYNGKNELVVRTYGKTQEELLNDHLNGKCDMFCAHCYASAMDMIRREKEGEKLNNYGDCPDTSEPDDDDWDDWDHCIPAEYYKNPKEYQKGENIYPNPNDEEIPF